MKPRRLGLKREEASIKAEGSKRAPFEESQAMTEPLYVSRTTLEAAGYLHRRARLATGETLDMGVHGPIASHFKLAPPRPLPLPVDYIVAATGG
jgi:hypothetical protein